jgi:hypothetical protein
MLFGAADKCALCAEKFSTTMSKLQARVPFRKKAVHSFPLSWAGIKRTRPHGAAGRRHGGIAPRVRLLTSSARRRCSGRSTLAGFVRGWCARQLETARKSFHSAVR